MIAGTRNWKASQWNKAEMEPYRNPILVWWAENGFPNDLQVRLSDNPDFLDVSASDMDVLQAWATGDRDPLSSLSRDQLVTSLKYGMPSKRAKITHRIIGILAASLLFVLLLWFLAGDNDGSGLLGFVPYTILMSLIFGKQVLRAYFRLRWNKKIGYVQSWIAIFLLYFPVFSVWENTIPKIMQSHLGLWWLMQPMGMRMIYVALSIGAWIVAIMLFYELFIRMALSAVRWKRTMRFHEPRVVADAG